MARAPEDNQMRDPPPVLFLDWRGVERGFLDACLEPRRVCESGRNELAKLAELGRKFTQTGHALRRRMLPHGVTIAVEPARKSPRWLVVDRPWEGTLNGPTVIHEEGRYRCWYLAIPPKGRHGNNFTFPPQRQGSLGSFCCGSEAGLAGWG